MTKKQAAEIIEILKAILDVLQNIDIGESLTFGVKIKTDPTLKEGE